MALQSILTLFPKFFVADSFFRLTLFEFVMKNPNRLLGFWVIIFCRWMRSRWIRIGIFFTTTTHFLAFFAIKLYLGCKNEGFLIVSQAADSQQIMRMGA